MHAFGQRLDVKTDSGTLCVWEWFGNPQAGAVWVFVHGIPSWSFLWGKAAEALQPHAKRLLAVDHLGFGASEQPKRADFSPQAHAARLTQVLDTRLLPQEKVILVVHDFGGPIGLKWAQDHRDRLAGIVVFNSFAWNPTHDPRKVWMAKLLRSVLGVLLYVWLNVSAKFLARLAYGKGSGWDADTAQQFMQPFATPSQRWGVLGLARHLVDPWYDEVEAGLKSLEGVPMTLIWGEKDTAFIPLERKMWKEKCPTIEEHSVAAGHFPMLEKSQEVNEILMKVQFKWG